jgi:hypothetical protein
MMTAGVAVPIEALATLRRRLAALPGRHPQREALLSSTAELYAVSRATVRILQLLVEHGVETPDGLQKLAPGRLTASTINRHMRRLGQPTTQDRGPDIAQYLRVVICLEKASIDWWPGESDQARRSCRGVCVLSSSGKAG